MPINYEGDPSNAPENPEGIISGPGYEIHKEKTYTYDEPEPIDYVAGTIYFLGNNNEHIIWWFDVPESQLQNPTAFARRQAEELLKTCRSAVPGYQENLDTKRHIAIGGLSAFVAFFVYNGTYVHLPSAIANSFVARELHEVSLKAAAATSGVTLLAILAVRFAFADRDTNAEHIRILTHALDAMKQPK